MNLCFLLGSGISIPAKLPSVGDLTNAILSSDRFIIESDGSVGFITDRRRPQYEEQQGREKVRRILIFLDWLKAQANCRYADIPERWVNYEDLAYLADQIHDDFAHEYENPALQPFVRNALIDLAGLFSGEELSAASEPLLELAGVTVNFVRSTVARLLSIAPSDTSYLQLFAQACREPAVSEVNLFTLNHDTLLEKFLRNDGIVVVDGLRCK